MARAETSRWRNLPCPVSMIWMLTVLLTLGLLCSTVTAGPIVTTRNGQVEGSRRVFNLKAYEEFLGIPFAAPPIGDLRWQRPQPPESWEGIRNATDYGQHCTQFIAPLYVFLGMKGSSGEDCLYVNVWVPRGVEANAGRQLPVMVFIYGGAFILGTGAMYPGHALALHGDVVVVNFNYRVGTLGWLSTGDSSLPGNYGLWDIEAALVWVQENIAAFAGDPSRVTIFGQSAGGALTSHTVISPKSRGLFQNAIAISGNSVGFFGLQQRPLRTAVQLASLFGCENVETSADITSCLQGVDAHSLDLFGTLVQIADSRLPNFAPVVDGDIVPLSPSECFENGYGRDVNYITGYCYDDAAGFVILNPIALPALGDRLNWAKTPELWNFATGVIFGGTSNADEIVSSIKDQYPDLVTDDNTTLTLTSDRAFTDYWFGAGSNWEATTRARSPATTGATYHYQFRYRQSFLHGYPEWVNGSHLDDIYSVLGTPFMESYRLLILRAEYNVVDLEVRDNVMSYYTNFAHTGNPNQGPNKVPVEWNQVDTSRQNYLHEGATFSEEEYGQDFIDNFQYWNDLPNMIEFPPEPTFPLPRQHGWKFTERDIEEAVEKFRQLGRELLKGEDEALAAFEESVIRADQERRRHLRK